MCFLKCNAIAHICNDIREAVTYIFIHSASDYDRQPLIIRQLDNFSFVLFINAALDTFPSLSPV